MKFLVVGLLIGSAIGGVIGYIFGYKKGVKFGNEANEAELASARAYIQKMESGPIPAPKAPEPEVTAVNNGAISVNQFSADGLRVARQPERVNYHACYGNTAPESYKTPKPAYMNDIKEGVTLLNPDDVEDSPREEELLKYWVGNGVLTNENDIPIDNPQIYVGPFLNMFMNNMEEERAFWVDSHIMGMRYRVEKICAEFDDDHDYILDEGGME